MFWVPGRSIRDCSSTSFKPSCLAMAASGTLGQGGQDGAGGACFAGDWQFGVENNNTGKTGQQASSEMRAHAADPHPNAPPGLVAAAGAGDGALLVPLALLPGLPLALPSPATHTCSRLRGVEWRRCVACKPGWERSARWTRREGGASAVLLD